MDYESHANELVVIKIDPSGKLIDSFKYFGDEDDMIDIASGDKLFLLDDIEPDPIPVVHERSMNGRILRVLTNGKDLSFWPMYMAFDKQSNCYLITDSGADN